jgi:hypothetical protein
MNTNFHPDQTAAAPLPLVRAGIRPGNRTVFSAVGYAAVDPNARVKRDSGRKAN